MHHSKVDRSRSSRRLARNRRWAWFATVATAIVVTACGSAPNPATTSPAEPPTSTSSSLPSATPASTFTSTTTTQPLSAAEALLKVLADPNLAVEVNVESDVEAPGLTFSSSGNGLISGEDSMLRLQHDFSGLSRTVIDTDGNLLGPNGLSVIEKESRFVDGELYEQIGEGRWIHVDRVEANTLLGHALAAVRQAGPLDDLGTEVRDGVRYRHLVPDPPIEYSPLYFGLNEQEVGAFETATDLYTDEAGTPLIVEVRADFEHAIAGKHLRTDIYHLQVVETPTRVERPGAWMTASDLGLAIPVLDFLMPDDWALVGSDKSMAHFRTPEGYRFILVVGPADQLDADQIMSGLTTAQGIELSERRPFEPARLIPGVIASGSGPNGEVLSLYTSSVWGVAVSVLWISPNEQPRTALFREILDTLHFTNLGDLPGETLSDSTLQDDVLTYLHTVDVDCDDSTVAYTKLVSMAEDGWSEDWYLQSCGVLKLARITFIPDPAGGTDFVIPPPEPVDGS